MASRNDSDVSGVTHEALGTSVKDDPDVAGGPDDAENADQRRPLAELFRELRTSSAGLAGREAARRLAVYGPNELTRRTGRRWPRELLDQFTQPLAILLAVAAVLAWVGGTPALSVAVIAVIVLNAAFAFVQEMQAERAVDALAANPLLLWGIVFELVFTGAVIYWPPLQDIFGTASLDLAQLAVIARSR